MVLVALSTDDVELWKQHLNGYIWWTLKGQALFQKSRALRKMLIEKKQWYEWFASLSDALDYTAQTSTWSVKTDFFYIHINAVLNWFQVKNNLKITISRFNHILHHVPTVFGFVV